MSRVNPVAQSLRWARTIQRRTCHCSSPNAVWHLDGHHKLVKYVSFFVVCVLVHVSVACPGWSFESALQHFADTSFY